MAVPTVPDLLRSAGHEGAAGAWAVLRRDFSGVSYLVARDLSEPAARFLARHFTDLGHHQAYWVEGPSFDPGRSEPGDIVAGLPPPIPAPGP